MSHLVKNTINCSTSILRRTNLRNQKLPALNKINLRFFGGCEGGNNDSRKSKKSVDPELKQRLKNYEPSPDCTVKCDEGRYSAMMAKAQWDKVELKHANQNKTPMDSGESRSKWIEKIPRKCVEEIICPPPLPEKKREKKEVDEKFKKCNAAPTIHQNCRKICLPGCAAVPIHCQNKRKPWDCVGVAAPYPSFSECRKPKLRPLPKSECHCLKNFSLCDEILRSIELKSRNIDPDRCAFMHEKKDRPLKKC